MRYKVRQAADMAGISRKTLYSHIKQGKVSAQTNTEGDKVIDHAELLRVYGRQMETPKDTQVKPKENTDLELKAELDKYKQYVATLVANNKALREQNALLKDMVVDAREREKDTSARYEKTLSIFERLLPRREN